MPAVRAPSHHLARYRWARLLHDHRFFLQKIWTDVIAADEDVEDQLPQLKEKFNFKAKSCPFCPSATDSSTHLRALIWLCKMAGERCQNLRFFWNNDKDGAYCDGYCLYVKADGSVVHHDMKSYHNLNQTIAAIGSLRKGNEMDTLNWLRHCNNTFCKISLPVHDKVEHTYPSRDETVD